MSFLPRCAVGLAAGDSSGADEGALVEVQSHCQSIYLSGFVSAIYKSFSTPLMDFMQAFAAFFYNATAISLEYAAQSLGAGPIRD